MMDRELAREWREKHGYEAIHKERFDNSVVELIARVRLEEAEWWASKPMDFNNYDGAKERLAALRQAAGK